MEPTKELVDQLYRERVEAARRMKPEDKLRAGLQLFELSSKIMADGIRGQFPEADDQRVQQIMCDRLALSRRCENAP
jgi:hypothetical protein